MVSANVSRILEAAASLTQSEYEQLRRLLQQRAARQAKLDSASELRQKLVDEGLLEANRPPRQKSSQFEMWQPIVIKGPPVSQTILEQRR